MKNWKTFYSNSLSNYQISVNGEVINDRTKTIQKLSNNTGGYKTIKIQRKWFLIHRVVAQAFIPNPNNLPNVCHWDNNPTNNSVDNLYWGSQSDNLKQMVKENRHAGKNQYTL
jgi:hypothetical protein